MAIKRHARLPQLRAIAQDMVKNVDVRAPHEAQVLQPNSATFHGRANPLSNGSPSAPAGENAYGQGFDESPVNVKGM